MNIGSKATCVHVIHTYLVRQSTWSFVTIQDGSKVTFDFQDRSMSKMSSLLLIKIKM